MTLFGQCYNLLNNNESNMTIFGQQYNYYFGTQVTRGIYTSKVNHTGTYSAILSQNGDFHAAVGDMDIHTVISPDNVRMLLLFKPYKNLWLFYYFPLACLFCTSRSIFYLYASFPFVNKRCHF